MALTIYSHKKAFKSLAKHSPHNTSGKTAGDVDGDLTYTQHRSKLCNSRIGKEK
jgi:hypothetical protein